MIIAGRGMFSLVHVRKDLEILDRAPATITLALVWNNEIWVSDNITLAELATVQEMYPEGSIITVNQEELDRRVFEHTH